MDTNCLAAIVLEKRIIPIRVLLCAAVVAQVAVNKYLGRRTERSLKTESVLVVASFTLCPLAPYRLDLTVWVLRRLPINRMDLWDGRTYRRVLALDSSPVDVEVTQVAAQSPELLVTVRGGRLAATRRQRIEALLDKMLGLNIDLSPFYRLVGSAAVSPDEAVRRIQTAAAGLRFRDSHQRNCLPAVISDRRDHAAQPPERRLRAGYR
jgi:hypothetical protein